MIGEYSMQNSYIEKPEVADIVRRFQSDYTKKYGTGILPSWKKALSDIATGFNGNRNFLTHGGDSYRLLGVQLSKVML